jgi:hypothetical protein
MVGSSAIPATVRREINAWRPQKKTGAFYSSSRPYRFRVCNSLWRTVGIEKKPPAQRIVEV